MPDSKITYLVTSYRDPEQIYRLTRTLRQGSPRARIVISHDSKSDPLDLMRLREHGADYWPTSTPITWGDGSYLKFILSAYSRLEPAENDWITTLSAQDYPVRSLRDFERHLLTCGADALLEETPDDPAERNLRRRYLSRSYRVPRCANRGFTSRVISRIPGLEWAPMPHGQRPIVARRVLRAPYPLSLVRRGNDLFAVNGRAVERLLRTPRHVMRHFERTPIPSEGFAHTILMNDTDVKVRPEILHFARWRASAHPDYLSVQDLPEILASSRWFARKFLRSDPILDLLDRHLAQAISPDTDV